MSIITSVQGDIFDLTNTAVSCVTMTYTAGNKQTQARVLNAFLNFKTSHVIYVVTLWKDLLLHDFRGNMSNSEQQPNICFSAISTPSIVSFGQLVIREKSEGIKSD